MTRHDRAGLSPLTILQIILAAALVIVSLYQWMR
jgi:hypothetical protein